MTLSAKSWAECVSLIPVEAKGKKPLTPWKEYQDRFSTTEERREWRKRWPDLNHGLVTGSISGYIVLDFDKEPGRDLFEKYKVRGTCPLVETANGFHAYYTVAAEEIGNHTAVVPGLDVRGEGGYVLIPPSIHPSGKKYRWITPPWDRSVWPAPPLPEWFLELLKVKQAADAKERIIIPSPAVFNAATFDDFARQHGCEAPHGGWIADGLIHRCPALGPDGRLGKGDGSYKIHLDPPIVGFVQNHHRHQSLTTQSWRPAR